MALDNEPVGARLKQLIEEVTTPTGRRIGGVGRQRPVEQPAEPGLPRRPSPYDYGASTSNRMRQIARDRGFGRDSQEGDYPTPQPQPARPKVPDTSRLPPNESLPLPPPAATPPPRRRMMARPAPREELSADDLNGLMLERMGRPVVTWRPLARLRSGRVRILSWLRRALVSRRPIRRVALSSQRSARLHPCRVLCVALNWQ